MVTTGTAAALSTGFTIDAAAEPEVEPPASGPVDR